MAINITSYQFNWKPVKGNLPKKRMICPRCKNEVDYFLAWDGEGIGIGGIKLLTTKKAYVYKCPICPRYDEISQEFAKAIIMGG